MIFVLSKRTVSLDILKSSYMNIFRHYFHYTLKKQDILFLLGSNLRVVLMAPIFMLLLITLFILFFIRSRTAIAGYIIGLLMVFKIFVTTI